MGWLRLFPATNVREAVTKGGLSFESFDQAATKRCATSERSSILWARNQSNRSKLLQLRALQPIILQSTKILRNLKPLSQTNAPTSSC